MVYKFVVGSIIVIDIFKIVGIGVFYLEEVFVKSKGVCIGMLM